MGRLLNGVGLRGVNQGGASLVMFLPLQLMLSRVVRAGDLTMHDARNRALHFGDGTSPRVAVRIREPSLERRLVMDPELAFGEAVMDGTFIVEHGSLYEFVSLIMREIGRHPLPRWTRLPAGLRWLQRRLHQFNPTMRARSNVAHHYDIDPRIYELFLDEDRQYSCAYFAPGTGGNLDRAQLLKKRHIAAKLDIEPGNTVLDIGCGWGGLALYLARLTGNQVTGVTLSREQLAIARDRSSHLGLSDAVTFALEDYRNLTGCFDRIVSVGMFEHVGVTHYPAYFRALARLLADDGVALVHTIGRAGPPTSTDPFIARYIFPGGYIPALSEIVPVIERSGLFVTDVEVLRLHYAETLRLWRERFLARRDEAVAIAGERFARMWELYLAGAEASFRYGGLEVFQIQLAKDVARLPLTRDYIVEAERRLAALEQGDAHPTRMAGE